MANPDQRAWEDELARQEEEQAIDAMSIARYEDQDLSESMKSDHTEALDAEWAEDDPFYKSELKFKGVYPYDSDGLDDLGLATEARDVERIKEEETLDKDE